jgi:hypothetical protein
MHTTLYELSCEARPDLPARSIAASGERFCQAGSEAKPTPCRRLAGAWLAVGMAAQPWRCSLGVEASVKSRAPPPWVPKDSELVLSTAGQALGARDTVAERSVPAELA